VGLGRGIPTIGLPFAAVRTDQRVRSTGSGPARSWGGPLNRALGARRVARQMVAPWIDTVNDIRARHGLASITCMSTSPLSLRTTFACCTGTARRSCPSARLAGGDRGGRLLVAGRPTNWTAPATSSTSLATGRPPIYVGFGSPFQAHSIGLDHAVAGSPEGHRAARDRAEGAGLVYLLRVRTSTSSRTFRTPGCSRS